jgi:hypothetical protein
MKALFVAVLAAALVGCTHPDMADDRKSTGSKVGARTAKPIAYKKTKAVAKPRYAGATTPSPTALPKSDPVTEKAKAAIAAMLDNPSSAEFYKLQRSQKKLLSRSVDAICGHVRAKSASGKSTGGMPFLYIVGDGREDEAYLVTGNSHVAQTVHGAVCR